MPNCCFMLIHNSRHEWLILDKLLLLKLLLAACHSALLKLTQSFRIVGDVLRCSCPSVELAHSNPSQPRLMDSIFQKKCHVDKVKSLFSIREAVFICFL